MIRPPIAPLPPRILFRSDDDYLAARNEHERLMAERWQEDRFLVAAHIVAGIAATVGILGAIGLLIYTIGGIDAVAWACGLALLFGALIYEIGKRI